MASLCRRDFPLTAFLRKHSFRDADNIKMPAERQPRSDRQLSER